MVDGLNASGNIPVKIVYKGTANSSKEVEAVMQAANNTPACAGVITWMHTFSPAKMWIKGLQALEKPLLHFHTQYNEEIPWDTIDMDFMNLNQSAHGDIEFGHICTRMRIARKVVTGYWKNPDVQKKIAVWARVAAGVADAKSVRCLMFGMNMNNVAVTDGDRVEFEQRLGYHVDYYPVSSLMEYLKKVTEEETDTLVEEYKKLYTIKIDETGEKVYWEKVRNAAKAEIAIRRVLKDKGATAFTTNFDDLGDADCGGLVSYNYFSGEPVTGLSEGRPLFVRNALDKFTLANFMRSHLYASVGVLKIGNDILFKDEKVKVERITGHGGLFKTPGVGQKVLAAALGSPISVMETAGEGGAWGIALLASYQINNASSFSLPDFLEKVVFAGNKGSEIAPTPEDIAGFDTWIQNYTACLPVEAAAVQYKK